MTQNGLKWILITTLYNVTFWPTRHPLHNITFVTFFLKASLNDWPKLWPYIWHNLCSRHHFLVTKVFLVMIHLCFNPRKYGKLGSATSVRRWFRNQYPDIQNSRIRISSRGSFKGSKTKEAQKKGKLLVAKEVWVIGELLQHPGAELKLLQKQERILQLHFIYLQINHHKHSFLNFNWLTARKRIKQEAKDAIKLPRNWKKETHSWRSTI